MHRFEENLYLGKEGRNICKILGKLHANYRDAVASVKQIIAQFYLPNVCRNTIFLREHDHWEGQPDSSERAGLVRDPGPGETPGPAGRGCGGEEEAGEIHLYFQFDQFFQVSLVWEVKNTYII